MNLEWHCVIWREKMCLWLGWVINLPVATAELIAIFLVKSQWSVIDCIKKIQIMWDRCLFILGMHKSLVVCLF